MKRKTAALLVLVLALSLSLTILSGITLAQAAGTGFFDVPAQTGYITDSGTNVGIYGTSSEYGSRGPNCCTQSPQFYAGIESEAADFSNGNLYGVQDLHITVTATNPNGGAVSGGYFTPLDARLSPDSSPSNSQFVLEFIYNAILNALPWGLGADIQYARTGAGGLSSGNPGNTAYADWTSCRGLLGCGFGDHYHGLYFGFQLQVGQALPGTYTINVQYHVEITECRGASSDGCGSTVVVSKDLSDTMFYCYQTCSNFHVSANQSPISVLAGGSSVTDTIVVTADNYLSPNPVSLSATSNDPSLTTSISPQTISLTRSAPDRPSSSAAATLSVSLAANSCKSGTFTVTVTADARGLSTPTTVSVTEPCDFTIAANPSSVNVIGGGTGISTIAISPLYGFIGTVSLSSTISPSTGLSCSLSATSIATSGTSTLSCSGSLGTYIVTVTGTSGTLSHSSSVTINIVLFSFRDDFSYTSVSNMVSAGWTLCGGAPQSYWSVGNGILTLQNDGSTGAYVCGAQIPSGISDWSVSTRTEWSGNTYGNLGLIVSTSTHSYLWQADGYWGRWDLQRDGEWNPSATRSYPGYVPQLYVWHTLAMDMRQGTLYLSFDGQLIGTYQEATPGVLTQITLPSEWSSYDSYDCVIANRIGTTSFSYNPPCSPPGQTITFSPTATFGSSPYTFSWNFGDGSSTSSTSSTSHTYIATGSYTVTLTATDAAGNTGTSTASITIGNANGPALYALRDDFSYTSLSGMTAAGWAACGTQSQVSVAGGVLSLTNNGSSVGYACWNNIPAGTTSWTVTDRGQYSQVLGGLSSTQGGIWVSATTASHTYELDLDGYYQSYYLWRDGVKVRLVGGYNPQLGTWHDLALDMRNGVLTALVDGKIITTYPETAGTNNALVSVTMRPGWETVTNYDWVSVTQVSDAQPAGFMFGFSPISVSAKTGTNAATTINLASLGGFTGVVSLAVQSSPATGLTCSLNPSNVSLSSSATSMMTCTGSVGTYTITVTGTSGGNSFSSSATIIVTT